MGLFDLFTSKSKEPKPSSFLGEYTEFHQILGGSQSTLYTAKHTKTGEVRAIKKVVPKDAAARQRLMCELEICLGLKNDLLIDYFGYEKKGDEYHILMEYFPGVSIRHFLKDAIVQGGRKPPFVSGRNFITLFLQAAQALAFVHGKGYLHLDVKPENLMVAGLELRAADDSERRVKLETQVFQKLTLDSAAAIRLKLIDFGVSIREGEKAALGGSTFYVAPEVVSTAGGGMITQAADIYSLASTFWEFSSGTPPYLPEWFRMMKEKNWNFYYPEYQKLPREARTSYERDMLKHRLTNPVDASVLPTSQVVRDILTKCLHPSPMKRYTKSFALARDLEGLLSRF